MVVTGAISNVVIIDIDKGSALRVLQDEYDLPETAHVKTPHGWHFYYRYPWDIIGTDQRIKSKPLNQYGIRIIGVDLLADRQAVALPPSVVEGSSGEEIYEWVQSPDDTTISELPDWMVEAIEKSLSIELTSQVPSKETQDTNSEYFAKARRWRDHYLEKTHIGNRNHNGFNMMLQLFYEGYPKCESISIVKNFVERCPQDTNDEYTLGEAMSSLDQVYQYDPKPPIGIFEKSQLIITRDALKDIPKIELDTAERFVLMLFNTFDIELGLNITVAMKTMSKITGYSETHVYKVRDRLIKKRYLEKTRIPSTRPAPKTCTSF